MRLRFVIRPAAVIVVSLVVAAACVAAEFSADTFDKSGGITSTGKLYVKGESVRREITRGTMHRVTIYQADKKVAYMLDPSKKTYAEISAAMSPQETAQMKKYAKELGTRKLVGTETVNGQLCDKYLYTFKNKAMGTQYQWVSKKLKWPIKVESKPNFLTECRNIKVGGVPDSVFEVPKGYKKVAMAEMMGGEERPHGMPKGMKMPRAFKIPPPPR